jgi:hypothetical protein
MHSFVEPRPKMMMMIITYVEDCQGISRMVEGERIVRGEEDGNKLHM